MRNLRRTVMVATAIALGVCALPAAVPAQTNEQQQAADNALPPALAAAMRSGNPDTVSQAINSLSAGNPQRQAELADQVMVAAERLLTVNPAAAVQIAASVMERCKQTTLQQTSPDKVLEMATIAARIMVNPVAQRIAPTQVAAMAEATTTVVTSPAIYARGPNTSIAVMTNAFAAANNPTVLASTPNVVSIVTASLTAASKSENLGLSNPTNGPQVAEILARQNQTPITGPLVDRSQPQQSQQQGQNTNIFILDRQPTNASPS